MVVADRHARLGDRAARAAVAARRPGREGPAAVPAPAAARTARTRAAGSAGSAYWSAVLRQAAARPPCVAAGALLAVAAPALGMKTENLTLDQEFGDSLPIVQHLQPRSTRPSPAAPSRPRWSSRPTTSTRPQVKARARRLPCAGGRFGRLARPGRDQDCTPRRTSPSIYVPLAGGSDQDKAAESLDTLRDEVRPDTLGTVDGLEAPITGELAGIDGLQRPAEPASCPGLRSSWWSSPSC